MNHTAMSEAFRSTARWRMPATLADFGGSPSAMLEHFAAHPELICDLDLERKPGSYARTLLWGDAETSVWALVWDSGAIAISLHIYGFDHRVHDSSVDREYVAARI